MPVLSVELTTLNEQHKHGSKHDTVTRGLTLYSRGVRHVRRQQDQHIAHVGTDALVWDGRAWVMQPGRGARHALQPATQCFSEITAVLVLCGLPYHLTASILCHEAFHVWCKLHTGFPPDLPQPWLEEGLVRLRATRCRFVADIFIDNNQIDYVLLCCCLIHSVNMRPRSISSR